MSASITAPTNKDVSVTISYPSDAHVKQYKIGSGSWTNYTVPVVISSNEAVYARCQDIAGNWSEVSEYKVTNIDKVKPTISLTPSTTEPTNEDVTITANISDNLSGIAVKKWASGNQPASYFANNGTELSGTTFDVSTNGTYTVYTRDKAGNETVKTITIDNIDKIAPVITIEPYDTNPTNKDIVVKAKVNEGTLNATSHTFTQNGSFEFVATDPAGNVTKKVVTITNIDKIAPVEPTFSSSTTAPINKDITVEINYPSDAHVKQYKIGESDTWKNYTEPLVFAENEIVYARCQDIAGNWSDVSSYEVTNIDKIPPVITIEPYNTQPTNQDIVVKASVNEGTLNATSHTFTQNGSFEFVAIDPAGNVTKKVVTITNIDKIAPVEPTFSSSTTAPTNKDVSVVINYPSDAVVKQYKVGKDGEWINYMRSIEFSENTTIYARCQDNAGNWSDVSSYEISNIDKIAPEVPTFEADKTKYTNTDVNVTITFPADAHIKQYKVGINGTWANYANPVVLSANDTVYARCQDIAGNWSDVSSYEVTNIDKVAPKAPKVRVLDYNILVIDESSDEYSGLDKYMYKLNNGEWKVYTEQVELPDGQYTIIAKAVDKAGNESTTTLEYLVFKQALEKATRAVEKAEATQLQSDVDYARPLVEILPEGDEKTELSTRLAHVQGCIDIDIMIKELTQIQSKIANDEIVNLSQIESLNSQIADIESRASKLPKSVDKAELNKLLKEVKAQIIANEAVIIAETSLRQVDVNNARVYCNYVTYYDAKYALNARLDVIQTIIDATEAVEKAKETENQNDIDDAWKEVDKMPEGDLKDQYQDELTAIDKKLKKAIEAVERAEAHPTVRNYIIDADNKVKALEDTVPQKPGLMERVQRLKDAYNASIENANYQYNLEKAYYYVNMAEKYPTDYYINKAQAFIDLLPEGDSNIEPLQARLDIVKQKFAEMKAPVDDKKLKDAERYVGYAEKYTSTDYYFNKAQKLVSELPDGPEKDALQARLDAIER